MRVLPFLYGLLCTTVLHAGTLTVTAPSDIKSAIASPSAKDTAALTATVEGPTATFADVPDSAPLSVQLKLADGTEYQGVDLSWYSEEPAKPDAGEMTDDDREAIRAIVQDVPSFYNKSDLLLLAGNHDRAVALVQLMRDTDFYAAGGNIVWRIELYYFKFQYGGWEKVQQQNKVVRRERFKTANDYKSATEKLKWTASLGGVRVGKDEQKRIDLTNDASPATRETKKDD